MLTILQGDALSVPISIKLNGIEVTTADIQAVKVTMGGIESAILARSHTTPADFSFH